VFNDIASLQLLVPCPFLFADCRCQSRGAVRVTTGREVARLDDAARDGRIPNTGNFLKKRIYRGYNFRLARYRAHSRL
jgi:hypothetical protein